MKYIFTIIIFSFIINSCGVKKYNAPCDAYGNGKIYNKQKKKK
jgi:hypothetical protein